MTNVHGWRSQHRVFSLLQPWTMALLATALLACGGPMVRTEVGI